MARIARINGIDADLFTQRDSEEIVRVVVDGRDVGSMEYGSFSAWHNMGAPLADLQERAEEHKRTSWLRRMLGK